MKTLELQKALRARGFYTCAKCKLDGDHGPLTDAAIIAFKRSKGLRARPLVGPKTRALLGFREAAEPSYDQPWMIEAERHLGLKEIPGKRHNPTILRWIRDLGGWFTDDETPWCGTFVAHCLRSAGIAVPQHWYRARAFAEWGVPCSPQIGAVAVFARRGGGHVGFIVGESDTAFYILGGNQRNEVNISPIDKSRLVNGGKGACRWPSGEKLGDRALPRMAGGVRTVNEA